MDRARVYLTVCERQRRDPRPALTEPEDFYYAAVLEKNRGNVAEAIEHLKQRGPQERRRPRRLPARLLLRAAGRPRRRRSRTCRRRSRRTSGTACSRATTGTSIRSARRRSSRSCWPRKAGEPPRGGAGSILARMKQGRSRVAPRSRGAAAAGGARASSSWRRASDRGCAPPLPKVLHRVAGRTLLEAVLDAAEGLAPARVVVVVGAGRERGRGVARRAAPSRFAVQDPPLGTGDAVARGARGARRTAAGPVLVLAGDTPLLRAGDARAPRRAAARGAASTSRSSPSVRPSPATSGASCATRRGRVAADRRGAERLGAREADRRGQRRRLLLRAGRARRARSRRSARNPVSRRVLPDRRRRDPRRAARAASRRSRPRTGARPGASTRAATSPPPRRWSAGAAIERALDAGRHGARSRRPCASGRASRSRRTSSCTRSCRSRARRTVEEGCEVLPFTRVRRHPLAPGAVVGPHCDVEGARIGAARARRPVLAAAAGLRARGGRARRQLRRDEEHGPRARASRRSTSPTSATRTIGAGSNIGAGVITCNYDGEKKHRTTIGEGAFIGSDTQLVAPVTVGDGAYVGAGTTVTRGRAGRRPGAVPRRRRSTSEGWVARRKAKKIGVKSASHDNGARIG